MTACGVKSRDRIFPEAAVGSGLGGWNAELAGSQIACPSSVHKLGGIWPAKRGKFRKGIDEQGE